MVCQLCESVNIVAKRSLFQGCPAIEEACCARVAILSVPPQLLARKVKSSSLEREVVSYVWK